MKNYKRIIVKRRERHKIKVGAWVALVFIWCGMGQAQFPSDYMGAPYHGAPVNGQPHQVPGRIFMGYYDDGGEGIAYHDNDSVNQGLPWSDNFRAGEGVDVEWTKEDDSLADLPRTLVPQHVYLIGWTGAGEWVNYTVNVQKTGKYYVSGMLSKDQGRIIRNIVLDNKDTVGVIDAAATGWWHLWRYDNNITIVNLPQGKHVLTVFELGEGNMQYLDFEEYGAGTSNPVRNSVSPVFRMAASTAGHGKIIVSFSLPHAGKTELNVLDITGKKTAACDFGRASAGDHTATVDAGMTAQGIYIVELRNENLSEAKILKIVR